MAKSLLHRLALPGTFLALLCGLVCAAVNVTAAQVAAAIAASPNASAQLKSYAASVGSLSMFESAGNLSAYNGSCCYGILQMNTANIQSVMGAGYSPIAFAQLPLQAQVNAWAQIMSPALETYPVKALTALGVFDSRKVDGALVLACIQLGTGNCMRMIMSRTCAGFSDRLGTTICKMADKINGTGASSSSSNSGTGGSSAPKVPQSAGQTTAQGNCISDGQGGCIPMNVAMAQGFQTGSGVSSTDLRTAIQTIAASVVLLIMGSSMVGLWKNYAAGALTLPQLATSIKKVLLAVMVVFVIMVAL